DVYINYYHKENTNKAKLTGFELQFAIQLKSNISLIGRMFYTFGEDITNQSPMRRIPPMNGFAAIKWNKNKQFWLNLEYQFASRQDSLSNGDIDDDRIAPGGTPAWNVFNITTGSQINKWVRINAGLNNIFDEAYRTHGSGVDAYGRYLWISLNLGKYL
ncbi:MAG: TonB-dependent receptor, partial [Bacteroidales bacterium]|nr:TonB-dependent receptor [Bacteroidales bacterium]